MTADVGKTKARPARAAGPRKKELERNTGFEPATFALATRQSGIHDSSGAYTNFHDPVISLGSLEPDPEVGSTNLHADSLASCAQHVPRRRPRIRRPSLDVNQVSELLGCSTALVYDLCERGELPHQRDMQNAIRFDCRMLGRALNLTSGRPTGDRKTPDAHTSSSTSQQLGFPLMESHRWGLRFKSGARNEPFQRLVLPLSARIEIGRAA